MATTLTLQSPKPSITEQFGKRASVTPVIDALEEEHKCDTIAMLLGHEDQNQDTLEDILLLNVDLIVLIIDNVLTASTLP